LSKIKLVLIGGSGRLGSSIQDVLDPTRFEVIAKIGKQNANDLVREASKADVVLDTSLPAATENYLAAIYAIGRPIPYVIGCTGWTDAQMKTVRKYAEKTCVVLAPNFSPGVNLLLGLIEQAAPLLSKWGYNAVVNETHHIKKLDSPSGTAKAIIERLGSIKTEVHSFREGDVVGLHEIRFEGSGDVLTLTHEAIDRTIFGRGALLAAEWAAKMAKPGLYSMKEVIFS
jgi:4-hydroxy-tetrahydrodipicolinate reductase